MAHPPPSPAHTAGPAQDDDAAEVTCAQCRVRFPHQLVLCTQFTPSRLCSGACQVAAWFVAIRITLEGNMRNQRTTHLAPRRHAHEAAGRASEFGPGGGLGGLPVPRADGRDHGPASTTHNQALPPPAASPPTPRRAVMPQNGLQCGHCGKQSRDMPLCTGCDAVPFCDDACLRAAWCVCVAVVGRVDQLYAKSK